MYRYSLQTTPNAFPSIFPVAVFNNNTFNNFQAIPNKLRDVRIATADAVGKEYVGAVTTVVIVHCQSSTSIVSVLVNFSIRGDDTANDNVVAVLGSYVA